MGQAMVRRCDSFATEGIVGCSSCSAAAQRRRLEELILEVEDARQENRSLTLQANRLRSALKDVAPDAVLGPQGPAFEGDYDAPQRRAGAASQAERGLGDEREMLHLKRMLKELQSENTMLKQTQAHSSGAGSRSADSRGAGCVGTVPLSAYEALRAEVEQLQRAHEAAAAQNDRLRHQAASGLQSRDSHVFHSSGLHSRDSHLLDSSMMPAAPPGRYPGSSAYGSTRTNGSAYASTRTSGAGTPIPLAGGGGSRCGARYGDGSYSDAGAVDDAEVRRKLQAMQLENEQLRRKVRMLASS